jgi:hypothetical protein
MESAAGRVGEGTPSFGMNGFVEKRDVPVKKVGS